MATAQKAARKLKKTHHILTICILGNFTCFCGRLLTFFKINFFKDFFQEPIRVLNCLDPGQDRQFVGRDLGPNC